MIEQQQHAAAIGSLAKPRAQVHDCNYFLSCMRSYASSDDIRVNQDRAMQICKLENFGCADFNERCAADAGRASLSRKQRCLGLSHFEILGVSGQFSLEPSCCPGMAFLRPAVHLVPV